MLMKLLGEQMITDYFLSYLLFINIIGRLLCKLFNVNLGAGAAAHSCCVLFAATSLVLAAST